MAQTRNGVFLLRIEDIDQSRARPEWESQIYDDLHWMGLIWPLPVMRQSERMDFYREVLRGLWNRGLLYPCTCNRRDIAAAASAPQEGGKPAIGPDGLVYPGTCRRRPRSGPMPTEPALRLDMAAALDAIAGSRLSFRESGLGADAGKIVAFAAKEVLRGIGDVVLARREMGTSYHLSVVLDDAAQGVTHVVRGMDLFEATRIHVILQHLLNLPVPAYHHHRLIRDAEGRRLAKRDDARAIAHYRAAGLSVAEVRSLVDLN